MMVQGVEVPAEAIAAGEAVIGREMFTFADVERAIRRAGFAHPGALAKRLLTIAREKGIAESSREFGGGGFVWRKRLPQRRAAPATSGAAGVYVRPATSGRT